MHEFPGRMGHHSGHQRFIPSGSMVSDDDDDDDDDDDVDDDND